LLLKVLNAFESFRNKQKSHLNSFCFLQTLWGFKLSSVLHCPPPALSSFHHLLNVMWVNTRELKIFIFKKNMPRVHLLKYNLNLKIISFKTSTIIFKFQPKKDHGSSFHLHNKMLCKSDVTVSMSSSINECFLPLLTSVAQTENSICMILWRGTRLLMTRDN